MIFQITSWDSGFIASHYYLECNSRKEAEQWCREREETYIDFRVLLDDWQISQAKANGRYYKCGE